MKYETQERIAKVLHDLFIIFFFAMATMAAIGVLSIFITTFIVLPFWLASMI